MEWIASLPGAPRGEARSFSIGDAGYIGCGFSNSSSIYFNDFWEYKPKETNSLNEINTNRKILIYPNPFCEETNLRFEIPLVNANISVLNIQGILEYKISNVYGNNYVLSIDFLENGFYFLNIEENDKVLYSKKIVLENWLFNFFDKQFLKFNFRFFWVKELLKYLIGFLVFCYIF